MKNFLMLLMNLYNLIGFFLMDMFSVIWYGKLPKVSHYHRAVKYTYSHYDTFNDINAQVRDKSDVPKYIQKKIICDYIDSLHDNPEFHSNVTGLAIPIFDGKEIIGTTSVYSIMLDHNGLINRD